MPPVIGSGKVWAGSDFVGGILSGVPTAVDSTPIGGGLSLAGVNEGSITFTVDESGGILAITTDTADNDNHVIYAGVWCPRDGKMVMRSRFKYSNVDTSIFVGFCETLSLATPVMPAEFATATMTYNPGGMIGLQYDVDGTTDDFRAVMGDGSAAISDSGQGIRANATVTADLWFEAEIILNEDGSGECWLADSGHPNSDGTSMKKRLIKHFKSGTLLTPTDVFHAILMIENRSGAARVLEVDYFYAEGGRDWRP